jgi:Cu/Ag efflux protein CusF
MMDNHAKRFAISFVNRALFAMCAGLAVLWPVFASNPASAQMQMKQGMQMQMTKEGVFDGKGKIVAVVPAKGQVVLDHEEIKGFMGPMTMGYAVASDELLKGLKPGDKVNFKIDAAEKKIVAIERSP